MIFLKKKKYIVGFFAKESIRVAEVEESAAGKRILRESSYTINQSGIIEKDSFKKEYGSVLRLIVSEEGLYTFSVTVPEQVLQSRKSLESALAIFFPESCGETRWDIRVVSREKGIATIEVIEMKMNWSKALDRFIQSTGVYCESIIPESAALACQVESSVATLLLVQKPNQSILSIGTDAKSVFLSLIVPIPKSREIFTGICGFCKDKKNKEISEIFYSGAKSIDRELLPEGISFSNTNIDPILGTQSRAWFIRGNDTLDFLDDKTYLNRFWSWFQAKTYHADIKTLTEEAKGFTLLEILIVVGIIVILATIIVVAIDPAERFRSAKESHRLSDIQSLSSVIHQYIIDKKGNYPEGIDEEEHQLGRAHSGCALTTSRCHVVQDECVDFTESLHPYLSSIPFDPETGSEEYTHYTVQREKNSNRIILRACDSNNENVVQ